MAATMAHEVHQPLTAIGNYLRAARRLLAASDPASRRKLDEALDKAADQAARAGEIIRRLRSLAKRGESNQRPEAIAQIVDEAASLAAVDARLRGVHVQLEPDPAAGLVLANRVQIQQVLLNLVRNALEAMKGHPRRELRIITAVPAICDHEGQRHGDRTVDLPGDRRQPRWPALGRGQPSGGTIFRFTLRSLCQAIDLDQGGSPAVMVRAGRSCAGTSRRNARSSIGFTPSARCSRVWCSTRWPKLERYCASTATSRAPAPMR